MKTDNPGLNVLTLFYEDLKRVSFSSTAVTHLPFRVIHENIFKTLFCAFLEEIKKK